MSNHPHYRDSQTPSLLSKNRREKLEVRKGCNMPINFRKQHNDKGLITKKEYSYVHIFKYEYILYVYLRRRTNNAMIHNGKTHLSWLVFNKFKAN